MCIHGCIILRISCQKTQYRRFPSLHNIVIVEFLELCSLLFSPISAVREFWLCLKNINNMCIPRNHRYFCITVALVLIGNLIIMFWVIILFSIYYEKPTEILKPRRRIIFRENGGSVNIEYPNTLYRADLDKAVVIFSWYLSWILCKYIISWLVFSSNVFGMKAISVLFSLLMYAGVILFDPTTSSFMKSKCSIHALGFFLAIFGAFYNFEYITIVFCLAFCLRHSPSNIQIDSYAKNSAGNGQLKVTKRKSIRPKILERNSGYLEINLIRGRLNDSGVTYFGRKANPYVVFKYGSELFESKTNFKGGKSPTWYQKGMIIPLNKETHRLSITVWDENEEENPSHTLLATKEQDIRLWIANKRFEGWIGWGVGKEPDGIQLDVRVKYDEITCLSDSQPVMSLSQRDVSVPSMLYKQPSIFWKDNLKRLSGESSVGLDEVRMFTLLYASSS